MKMKLKFYAQLLTSAVLTLAGFVLPGAAQSTDGLWDATVTVNNIPIPFRIEMNPPQKLIDNATTVINSVVRAKPSAAKGKYIRGITLSSTMGPGIPLDSEVAEAAGKP